MTTYIFQVFLLAAAPLCVLYITALPHFMFPFCFLTFNLRIALKIYLYINELVILYYYYYSTWFDRGVK